GAHCYEQEWSCCPCAGCPVEVFIFIWSLPEIWEGNGWRCPVPGGQVGSMEEEAEGGQGKRNDFVFAVDVSLDADTAHPRLELSPDGKSVKDTGTARSVPRTEKRFDSHTFLLAKEGYTSGKYYWEVDVGKRRNWDVGIAREPVTRKGTLTLSPEKGFWVIGLADGQDYWARTVPWSRLAVSGKPRKIGIFLDVSAKKLSFFNVNNGTHLHTFILGGDSRQEGKFYPFFSTGSTSAKPDTEKLGASRHITVPFSLQISPQ
uniref:B30.2/SPRY domain-containing protein n=1 Tax=Apteryx owenii TaxID=8824 RepID=A0A8B9NWL1_APTOW